MVYSNIEDGYVKGIAISCSCGCSMMQFKTLEDYVYISVYGSNWYSYQGQSIAKNNFRHFMDKLKRNKMIIADFSLTNKQMKKFIKLAEELYFEESDDEDETNYENDSHISLEYDKEVDYYYLEVISDMPLSEIIFNKWHRGYEISLSQKDWISLVKKMKRYIAYVEK